MTQIMLHRDRTETFRRCVRKSLGKDETGKGKVIKALVFPPGDVVEVKGRDLDAIKEDLKKGVIVEVAKDDRGRFKPVKKAKPDTVELTLEEFDREIAEAEARGGRNALSSVSSNGDGNGEHAA